MNKTKHRRLKKGELIRAGDEAEIGEGVWVQTAHVGEIWTPLKDRIGFVPMRRKIQSK